MALVSWSYSPEDHAKTDAVMQEVARLEAELPQLARHIGLPESVVIHSTTHQGTLNGEQPLAPQWRVLLAQSLIKLEQQTTKG